MPLGLWMHHPNLCLQLQMAFSLFALCVQISPFYRNTSHIGLGSNLVQKGHWPQFIIIAFSSHPWADPEGPQNKMSMGHREVKGGGIVRQNRLHSQMSKCWCFLLLGPLYIFRESPKSRNFNTAISWYLEWMLSKSPCGTSCGTTTSFCWLLCLSFFVVMPPPFFCGSLLYWERG